MSTDPRAHLVFHLVGTQLLPRLDTSEPNQFAGKPQSSVYWQTSLDKP